MTTPPDELVASQDRLSGPRLALTQMKTMLYRHRDRVPLILALAIILVAAWGYRGNNAKLLGPPLGELYGQDFRQVLRAAYEIKAGNNPYIHALEFGRSPDFKEFMTWEAAPYPYPPVVATLARPFLWLDADTALKLWSGVNLALLLGGAMIAAVAFSNNSRTSRSVCFILMLTLFYTYGPTQIDLKLGQLDILILFLLLFTYFLYRSGYDLACGLPLALAIAIKPLVGPLLLFFIWKRRWRTLITTMIAAFVLTVLGFAAVGWDRLPDYMAVNRLWASGGMLDFPFNQSLNGLARRMFTSNIYSQPLYLLPDLGHLVPLLVGVLAVGMWLTSVSRANNREDSINGVEFGLTLTTIMLLSPLVDDIHFVWVLMPLSALLLSATDKLSSPKSLLLLVICLLITLYLGLPDLHKAIYVGWESLAFSNTLIERSSVLYTGAYLYGLIALQVCATIFLLINRPPQRANTVQQHKLREMTESGGPRDE